MADHIIVLEKAKIIEEGSHQELLQANGQYATLFNLQAQGYK
jgi:ABC-type multidrug transport system fused ATPase/permease subunit